MSLTGEPPFTQLILVAPFMRYIHTNTSKLTSRKILCGGVLDSVAGAEWRQRIVLAAFADCGED
jgi:hypothetical protein